MNGRESNHSLYQWPSQAFKSNTKIEVAVCEARQLVSGESFGK